MAGWNIKYPYVSDEILNLDWVLSKIREFEAVIDDLQSTIEELKAGLANLGQINLRLDALEAATSDLNDMRAALRGLAAEDATLQSQIDALNLFIGAYDDALKNLREYIDSKIAVVNKRIDTLAFDILSDANVKIIKLQKQLDALTKRIDEIDTTVLNPWHWGMGRIDQDKNINYVYNDLADECLTAEQYCKLGLSASDYTTYDLTARDYWEFGKTKLHFRWVYSPLEGFKQDINVVLSNIANWLFGTLSADDYAALDLSADDYAALDLTAILYMLYNTNGTLTADDYAALGSLNNGLTFNYRFI